MIDRHLYKGYLLSYAPMQLDDGRWQARLGIASMSTTKTRAQRFFDLGFFETEADAALAQPAKRSKTIRAREQPAAPTDDK